MSKYNSDWIERNTFYAPIPGSNPPHYQPYDRPVIVCFCGSTRFKDAFVEAAKSETLAGKIYLSVGMFGHVEGLDMDGPVKAELDTLHKRKIDLADEILVLNVGGYVGESTRSEVENAHKRGKTIHWLEPYRVPADLEYVGGAYG